MRQPTPMQIDLAYSTPEMNPPVVLLPNSRSVSTMSSSLPETRGVGAPNIAISDPRGSVDYRRVGSGVGRVPLGSQSQVGIMSLVYQ